MKNKISVAMATYNGEKYIEEQIISILNNISQEDELVISDDLSTDNTINIIKQFNDKRIKLIEGPKKGIKKNFENAIKNCTGEIIFLADQDDVWMRDKVKKVLKIFESDSDITLVIHNCEITDKMLKVVEPSFFKFRKSKRGIIKNIIKNSYIGCCIAFKKEIRDYILPIPNDIEMHDQWIGIINEMYGKTYFFNEQLIKYRRHEDNNDKLKHYGLKKMIKNRINLISNLLKMRRR